MKCVSVCKPLVVLSLLQGLSVDLVCVISVVVPLCVLLRLSSDMKAVPLVVVLPRMCPLAAVLLLAMLRTLLVTRKVSFSRCVQLVSGVGLVRVTTVFVAVVKLTSVLAPVRRSAPMVVRLSGLIVDRVVTLCVRF